jgi:opacity protein-like surface antigen
MRHLILRTLICIFLGSLAALPALALYTEFGVSYNYKTIGFGADYKMETQASTVSTSVYAWDQVGVEFAYTESLLLKKEPETGAFATTRTTSQKANIYELNVQYLFSNNRKAMFQPYIKAGAAYTAKKQTVQIGNDFPFELSLKPGLGPSYGAGIKIFFTESLSLKLSYDIVETPVDEKSKALDSTGRIGMGWIL